MQSKDFRTLYPFLFLFCSFSLNFVYAFVLFVIALMLKSSQHFGPLKNSSIGTKIYILKLMST